jgi:hypothetical protein
MSTIVWEKIGQKSVQLQHAGIFGYSWKVTRLNNKQQIWKNMWVIGFSKI